MVISPTLTQLFQSGFIVGVVVLLVNLAAPFLERYAPFAKPDSSTHDVTLQALNLALNVGLALGFAALLSQLGSGQDILAVIGYGIAQATGSHVVYASGNRSTPPAPAPQPAPLTPQQQAALLLVKAIQTALSAS